MQLYTLVNSRPVAPACIAGSGFQGEVYGPATVSGWGTTSSGGNLANTLRDGKTPFCMGEEPLIAFASLLN